jgi:uncharacterized protein with HEPN domain
LSSIKKSLSDFIQHIQIGIEKIERHTNDLDLNGFLKNDLIQDAVLRNLEIIGEASNNILKNYPEFSSAHPEIQFSAAYQMRNAVLMATSPSTFTSFGQQLNGVSLC